MLFCVWRLILVSFVLHFELHSVDHFPAQLTSPDIFEPRCAERLAGEVRKSSLELVHHLLFENGLKGMDLLRPEDLQRAPSQRVDPELKPEIFTGGKPVWPSIELFLNHAKWAALNGGPFLNGRARVVAAKKVEICSAFEKIRAAREPGSQRNFLVEEIQVEQNLPVKRYITNQFLPADVQLLQESLKIEEGRVIEVFENLEIRVHHSTDPSDTSSVRTQQGDGVVIQLRNKFRDEAKDYLGDKGYWVVCKFLRLIGLEETIFGEKPIQSIVREIQTIIEESMRNGRSPILVEIAHTHPFDALLVTDPDPTSLHDSLLWASISSKDKKVFHSIVRRLSAVALNVPIAISAISGLHPRYLTKEYQVYFPSEN